MNSVITALRNHPFRVILVVLLGVGAYFGYIQLTGYQQLTIELKGPSDSGSVKVYSVPNNTKDSPGSLIKDLEPKSEITQTTTMKLRKGHYVVVGGTTPDYNPQYEKVNLADQPVTVVIDPAFSDARLAAMLEVERPAIQAVIKQFVPGIDTKFLLGPGRLFGEGEWYGTVIYPNLTPEQRRLQYVDVYHVVAKKEGDTWKVATMPPEIILSAVTYPSIPRDVLVNTNNQKQP